MSRWSVLKARLHKKSNNLNDEANELSIHSFLGYQVIKKSKLLWKGYTLHVTLSESIIDDIVSYFHIVDCCEIRVHLYGIVGVLWESLVEKWSLHSDWTQLAVDVVQWDESHQILNIRHKSYDPFMKSCSYLQYTVIPPTGTPVILHTREPANSGISIAGLLSHLHHGVDNTGNVCMWPSETILLHTLLTQSKYMEIIQSYSGGNVLEIGGGMTALVGLALSKLDIYNQIIVTDGHPDCVRNQSVCIEMNHSSSAATNRRKIQSKLLRWTRSLREQDKQSFDGITKFELIVVSDCLFFKEFHEDLLETLIDMLAEDGRVLLLQPKRGGTMDMFLNKAEDVFHIELDESYNNEVGMRVSSPVPIGGESC